MVPAALLIIIAALAIIIAALAIAAAVVFLLGRDQRREAEFADRVKTLIKQEMEGDAESARLRREYDALAYKVRRLEAWSKVPPEFKP